MWSLFLIDVFLNSLNSLCKKTPTTAPKKNRGKLLFSFLNQLSRSGFCKVFTLKTNKKHNRDSLDSKTSKAPRKKSGQALYLALSYQRLKKP